jgi:uncharacterized protein YbbC (DUF1343 family)
LGAPWLDATALGRAVAAPGFAVEPVRFTPRGSEAAPQPKYASQECAGLKVRVIDPGAAQPYRFGISLLATLRRQHADFRWREGGVALDRLLGTSRVRVALERGDSVDALVVQDAEVIEQFRRERGRALLYR